MLLEILLNVCVKKGVYADKTSEKAFQDISFKQNFTLWQLKPLKAKSVKNISFPSFFLKVYLVPVVCSLWCHFLHFPLLHWVQNLCGLLMITAGCVCGCLAGSRWASPRQQSSGHGWPAAGSDLHNIRPSKIGGLGSVMSRAYAFSLSQSWKADPNPSCTEQLQKMCK